MTRDHARELEMTNRSIPSSPTGSHSPAGAAIAVANEPGVEAFQCEVRR